MRAAVVDAPRHCRIEELCEPEPEAGQVRIRLEGTGVCASDLPVWEGRPWFSYPLHPGQPGHEGWGRVESTGHGVSGLKEGDRVAAFSFNNYATCTVANAADVVPLPKELDGRPFPGEPLACAMNAFRRCGIDTGNTVALVGAGFQGLLLTQLASRAGARVVAMSRRETPLKMALRMGADAVVLMDDHSTAVRKAMGYCGGQGYDCVIEATGAQWPLDLAGELTKVRGRLAIVGYHQDPRQVNMQQWNWRGIDVINAHERDAKVYVEGMREAVSAAAEGRIDPWPLFTHEYALQDLEAAMDDASSRPEGFLKALVYP